MGGAQDLPPSADRADTETGFGFGLEPAERGDGVSKSKRKKGGIGSSFDAYLKGEGTYEETSAAAIKRTLAWQLEDAMAKEGMSKNAMAKRMHTSRSQLDRILDPSNDRIQLDTVFKAARALGRQVKLELA